MRSDHPTAPLSIAVRHEGDVPVVHLTGYVDAHTGADLARVIDGLVAVDTPRVRIDCTELTFMDSTLLQIIASAPAGTRLEVREVSPTGRRLFALTGLEGTLAS